VRTLRRSPVQLHETELGFYTAVWRGSFVDADVRVGVLTHSLTDQV
jgi:hypothetical protein